MRRVVLCGVVLDDVSESDGLTGMMYTLIDLSEWFCLAHTKHGWARRGFGALEDGGNNQRQRIRINRHVHHIEREKDRERERAKRSLSIQDLVVYN